MQQWQQSILHQSIWIGDKMTKEEKNEIIKEIESDADAVGINGEDCISIKHLKKILDDYVYEQTELNCEMVENHTQVQPTVSKTEIVRTPEEIADFMVASMNCGICTILNDCDQKIRTCETRGRKACIDWLTKNLH